MRADWACLGLLVGAVACGEAECPEADVRCHQGTPGGICSGPYQVPAICVDGAWACEPGEGLVLADECGGFGI